jgi:monoamine oxidase
MKTSVQVAVVGAGLAGLTAAFRLEQAGLDVALFEANPERVGGRCWTERSFFGADQIAEHGAQRIDTRHLEIRELAAELGLDMYDHLAGQESEALATVRDPSLTSESGEVAPMASILHDALLADMARRGISVGGPPGDDALTEAEAELDAISVADWIEANLDGGIASPTGQAFVTALAIERGTELSEVGGFFLAEGYDMIMGLFVGAVDHEHVERVADARYQVNGGNDRLPDALRSRLSPGVLTLGAKLTKLAGTADGRVELDFASGLSVSADAVILALPFTTLRQVDLADADFSDSKRAAIDELPLGDLTKIIMQFDRPRSDFPEWDGVVYSTNPRLIALCTSTGEEGEEQQAGSMIVTAFFGGADCRALSNGVAHAPATEAVVSPVLDVLDAAVPGLKAAFTGLAWMDSWCDNEYSLGAFSAFRPGQTARFHHVIGVPEGSVFFAGEHTSTSHRGFMNGAVESGERASREVMAFLG